MQMTDVARMPILDIQEGLPRLGLEHCCRMTPTVQDCFSNVREPSYPAPLLVHWLISNPHTCQTMAYINAQQSAKPETCFSVIPARTVAKRATAKNGGSFLRRVKY